MHPRSTHNYRDYPLLAYFYSAPLVWFYSALDTHILKRRVFSIIQSPATERHFKLGHYPMLNPCDSSTPRDSGLLFSPNSCCERAVALVTSRLSSCPSVFASFVYIFTSN